MKRFMAFLQKRRSNALIYKILRNFDVFATNPYFYMVKINCQKMSAEKYQNKYRIPSARMKNYDYSSNGAYFITILTKNREHFFGEIVGDIDRKDVACNVFTTTMQLSPIGEIAQKFWNEIPQHFPFIRLDEMVVMPNHIHGILWIDNDDVVGCRDVACNVYG